MYQDVRQQRHGQDRGAAGGAAARGPQLAGGGPRGRGAQAEGDLRAPLPQLRQLLAAVHHAQHRPLHDGQDEAGQGEAHPVPTRVGENK